MIALISISLLTLTFLIATVYGGGDELEYPSVYELEDGGSYKLAMDYCDYRIENLLRFTGRCWCWTDPDDGITETCSIPGPTLVIYNGTKFDLTVTNRMTGDSESELLGAVFKDPDVTNLHTHGLHISSLDDDPLLVLNPGDNHTYTFDIHSEHYPGNHWYHPHHDGSVGWQIRGGAYGALIVKYDNRTTDINSPFFEFENLRSHVLMIQSLFVFSNDTCNCMSSMGPDSISTNTIFSSKVTNFGVLSTCYIWCEIDVDQRMASGSDYDVISLTNSGNNTDIDNMTYVIVNGQYQKTINMYLNDWHILKLFNTGSAQYTQFYFSDTDCSYYLLSRDGIYFKNGPRNLTESPTYGYLLIPPGGRAEIAIKCTVAGVYELKLTHDDFMNDFKYLSRMPEQVLVYLNVTNIGNNDSSMINSDLPMTTPDYPLYLHSLLDEDNESVNDYQVVKNCSCSQYEYDSAAVYGGASASPNLTFSEGQCGFELQFLSGGSVDGISGAMNNVIWNASALYHVNFETIYEFYVGANSHPLHQHVNPMQIAGTYMNGILAEKGDWVDTYGNPDNFTYRTITLDYVGHVVLHCHIVDHEDEGMMAYYRINETLCEGDEPSMTPTNAPNDMPSSITSLTPSIMPSDSTNSPTPASSGVNCQLIHPMLLFVIILFCLFCF